MSEYTKRQSKAAAASAEACLPASSAEMLGVPTQIGNYSVLARIGEGGMANVYLARQWGPDGFARNVALKLLLPEHETDPVYLRMFRDEAQLGALIDHPNVCGVLDFGESAGHHYIALEYLVGESLYTLLTRLAEHPDWLSNARYYAIVARMLSQCCDGLHAVHQAIDAHGRALHAVHRDVSPHNLFALYDGSIRVVDFGVARHDLREHVTTAKLLRGKVSYMSPEHITGRDVDGRSDVWSMGVVLWELLTGQRLFRRKVEIDSMRAVASEPVPAPGTFNREVPPALARIALRALNRDLSQRYQSSADMAIDLEAYATHSGVPTHASAVRSFLMEFFPSGERLKLELLARFKGVESSGTFPASRSGAEAAALASLVVSAPCSYVDLEPTRSEPLAASATDTLRSTYSVRDPSPDSDNESTLPLAAEGGRTSTSPLPLVRQKSGRKRELAWAAAIAAPLVVALVTILVSSQQEGWRTLVAPTGGRQTIAAIPMGTPASAIVPTSGTAATGALVVTSPLAGVSVFSGGEFLGVTPLHVRLAEGDYHLEARYPDGRRALLATHIRAGARSSLSLPH